MGNTPSTATLGVMLKGFHRHLTDRLRSVHRMSDEAVAADLASLGLRFYDVSEARIQWLSLMSTLQAHLSMFLIEPPLTPLVHASPPAASSPSVDISSDILNAAARVATTVLQGMFPASAPTAEPEPESRPQPPLQSDGVPPPPATASRVPEAVVEDPDSESEAKVEVEIRTDVAAPEEERASTNNHNNELSVLLADLPETLAQSPLMQMGLQVMQSHPELMAQLMQTLQAASTRP